MNGLEFRRAHVDRNLRRVRMRAALYYQCSGSVRDRDLAEILRLRAELAALDLIESDAARLDVHGNPW